MIARLSTIERALQVEKAKTKLAKEDIGVLTFADISNTVKKLEATRKVALAKKNS